MEIELRQVIRAALRWAWLIALATVLTGALAYLLTSGQTPTYTATTTLLVNPQQVMGATENTALQASRSQAETYVRLVESGPVLDRVTSEMGLDLTRGELANKIEATVILNTQLIEITVSDESAEQAARIANAVAMHFEGHVHDLTVGRLEENLAQAQAQIDALRTRQAQIDIELADLDTDANADDATVQAQITALEDERARAAETEADLTSQVRTINTSIATVRSPVEVADSATPAREPDSPRPLLMTALGLFLGFLIGVTLAAILEFMDRKVRPETDIEELTNSRVLGVVEQDKKKRSASPLVVTQPDSQASEAIRMLRTHLVGYARSDTHGAIAFANAGAGSASSDILANLGVVMAQSGLNTVIIDANLRSPRQHEIFGTSNEEGLADVLSRSEETLSAVDATVIEPNLSLITAGVANGQAAQLVSSSRFGDLVQRIRREANVVLIDAPPALEYSDALSAGSVADGVIIVGRYGSTHRDDLAALAETIQQDGMELLGVVMVKG